MVQLPIRTWCASCVWVKAGGRLSQRQGERRLAEVLRIRIARGTRRDLTLITTFLDGLSTSMRWNISRGGAPSWFDECSGVLVPGATCSPSTG